MKCVFLGYAQHKREELIIGAPPQWNLPLLCSLPLSISKPKDRLIWHFNLKGLFIVKSAYYVVLSWIGEAHDVASSSIDPNPCEVLWKKSMGSKGEDVRMENLLRYHS